MAFKKNRKSKRDDNQKTQVLRGVEEARQATVENEWQAETPQRQERVPLYTPQNKDPRTERKEAYQEYLELRREAKGEQQEERDQPKKKRPRKKKKKKKLKRIILVILLLVVALVICGFLFVTNVLGKVGRVDLDQADLGINPGVEANLKNYRNIALLGVDARDMDDYSKSRTDAIILVSLNKETKKVRQISVFRDTYLHVDDKIGYDKVTNVHAHKGTQGTIHTLNENMDLNIKEVGILNWKSVADIIDGIDGIEVNIKKSEINEMNKYIKDTQRNIGGSKKLIKKAGKQTLNGNQAVTYARIRHDSPKGDYRRNERMKIVLTKTMEKAGTLNPFELNKLANEVLPDIKTNMTTNQMMEVLWNLLTYDSGKKGGWPFDVKPWTSYGVWYGPPVTLEKNVSKLHKKYFSQPDYTPTERVQQISNEISQRTGYY